MEAHAAAASVAFPTNANAAEKMLED